MNEPIDIYILRKTVYQIMFDFDEEDYSEDTYLFGLVFIESLKNIVEYHVKNNDLSQEVRENIRKFLSQAREYKDENREKRIEFINDIIKMMNSQKEDGSLSFYRLQLFFRTNEFKYLCHASNLEVRNQIPHIHDCICNDAFVLTTHSENIDDMEFITEYLPSLKDSELYYETLNIILRENPIVFKDTTFYNRMICVLEFKNLKNEEFVKYNEKLVKKINRKTKKYK